MGGSLVKTDLGHGRGWASPSAAASIRRIDEQLGRLADINEAGRSPEQANENRRKWLAYARYLNGGPWAPKAPYALGADESVHCWGGAADTDDWYNAAAAAVWRDNGWRQTARYPGNKSKDEPWHGEYFLYLDNHRDDVAGGGNSTATPIPLKEDSMRAVRWNGKHVFTFGEEKCSYQSTYTDAVNAAIIHNPDQKWLELDDNGLTTALRTFGIPWSAVDACMRGWAYDITGAVGGHYWSRGIELKIDTATLAKSLADLRVTAETTMAVAADDPAS
jgi:hypothetical protein